MFVDLSETGLPEGKKCFVNGEYVVFTLLDEIFHDDVGFAAAGEGIACTPDEILCLVQVQFKSNCESQGSHFAWLVVGIVPYLGKMPSVHIRTLVDLGVSFSLCIDEAQQRFGEGIVRFIRDSVRRNMILSNLLSLDRSNSAAIEKIYALL